MTERPPLADAPIAGVDEAGRGSILGPLVVAAISAGPESLRDLEELGVTDSKLLTRRKRSYLYDEIIKRSVAVHSVAISPPQIDEYVTFGRKYRRLNYLETVHMAELIARLGTSRVFVDAPDANPVRFRKELSEMLDPCPTIVAEHKADRNYVVVGAASIVAKVERDLAIERLRQEHGNLGSGYPSDRHTIEFLKEYVRREGFQPPFARRSWKTWSRILVGTLDL